MEGVSSRSSKEGSRDSLVYTVVKHGLPTEVVTCFKELYSVSEVLHDPRVEFLVDRRDTLCPFPLC